MDLMKMVLGTVTPAIAGKVAQAMGMESKTVERLLGMAIPVILSGVLGATRKPEVADSFGKAFREMGDTPLDSLNDALATDPSRVSGAGTDLLGSLLGSGTLGTLVSKMADFGGMSKENSGSLMGLAGSMAMGSLGKAARDQNLDAAGALKMLEGQKDNIAAAIPPDLARALDGTGVLAALDSPVKPAAAAAKPTATPKPVTAPEPKKSGLTKWLLLAAAALLLLWLLPRFLGGPEEVVEPVVETEEVAPVEEAAPEEEAAAPAIPEVFGTVEGALAQLTTALGSVTDVASAEAALPQLQEVDTTLGGAEAAMTALSGESRTMVQTAIAASMPTIQGTVDGLMADSAIGAVLQPVVDSIMAKLAAYSG